MDSDDESKPEKENTEIKMSDVKQKFDVSMRKVRFVY